MNALDRLISYVDPQAGLRRERARAIAEVIARRTRRPGDPLSMRHYEGAASGRRTQGWRKTGGDANAVIGEALKTLRDVARDLVRNNGYAESALTTIRDHTVGWGLTPKSTDARAMKAWKGWADSFACDADGRHDFAGLQGLVMRTVAESGECLIRRRRRLPEDKLPLPMQIQVLEPDYLDSAKDETLQGGARIIHGVEFDPIGRRSAYWLFREHPGARQTTAQSSNRVPAEDVLHVFRTDRPGQVRGASWFAPVMLKFKDFDEFDDATLMKQKIAACLAVILTDTDGTASPLGMVDPDDDTIDLLGPGAVIQGKPGQTATVVNPPNTTDFPAYSATALRAIATGLGITYEDLTGDFSQVNFSSARLARLKHWARVEEWRWQMLVPLFCVPVWAWVMEAAAIAGQVKADAPGPDSWTASPLPMIDPNTEGLSYQRLVRSGFMSLSEALRERGYDPDVVLAEIAADNAKLDKLGLVLDSDPRKTSQAGQPTATTQATPPADPTADPADPAATK